MSARIVTLPLAIHVQSDRANQLAQRFLDDVLKTIETRFKDDLEKFHLEPRHYAARHPKIVSALINAHTTAFQTLAISEALREIRAVLDRQNGEFVSVAKSVYTTLDSIDTNLNSISGAIKMLDRS